MIYFYGDNKIWKVRAEWREHLALQKRKLRNFALSFPLLGCGGMALCIILEPLPSWVYGMFDIILYGGFNALFLSILSGSEFSSLSVSLLSLALGALFGLTSSWHPEGAYEDWLTGVAIAHFSIFLAFLAVGIILWFKPDPPPLQKTKRVIQAAATTTGSIMLVLVAPILITSFMYLLVFVTVLLLTAYHAYSVYDGSKKLKKHNPWDWESRQLDLIPIAIQRTKAKFFAKLALVLLLAWPLAAWGHFDEVFDGWGVCLSRITPDE